MEGALIRVPVLGGALADLALARLAWSLEALLSAGMLVTEAWPISARAGGMARLERVVEGWSDALEAGATPGEMVVASGVFPEAFASSYLTGEASGRLEQELGRLARQHEGGDHLILIGEVEQYRREPKQPLLYHRGGYAALAG